MFPSVLKFRRQDGYQNGACVSEVTDDRVNFVWIICDVVMFKLIRGLS